MENSKIELKAQDSVMMRMDLLEPNEGQLEGLPENPREILSHKYELLKKNIEDYPQFLKYNQLKVYPLDNGHYIIIGGNMRYRAMKELGFIECPVAVIDPNTPIEDLKAYTILDNSGFGRWEWQRIANEWDSAQLADWGVDLPVMESSVNIDDFFDSVDDDAEKGNDAKIVITIPEAIANAKGEIIAIVQESLKGQFPECKVR